MARVSNDNFFTRLFSWVEDSDNRRSDAGTAEKGSSKTTARQKSKRDAENNPQRTTLVNRR